MKDEDLRIKLVEDAARALGMSAETIPADLTDRQMDKVLGLARGTAAVKRCHGNFPIPSYKIGRLRKTPFSSIIDFKLEQLERQAA
ncbi:MAG: hypothetical protein GKR95_02080 [Gammaproteobacteria bacterium]|nr:hypothetical protein [Gammaproteobacteria bacterium]